MSRSAEEDSEFKTGVNLFVSGCSNLWLTQIRFSSKHHPALQDTRSANKASRAEKLAILADRLEQMLSARKETPKVVEVKKKSVRTASTSGSEFKSPRSSNLPSLWNQADIARKETPKVVEVKKKSVRKAPTPTSEFKSPRSSNSISLLNQAAKARKETPKGSANKSSRAEKLAILADRLEQMLSARKKTPKVVEVKKKSVRTVRTPGSEFKSPRSSNLTSLWNQADIARKETPKVVEVKKKSVRKAPTPGSEFKSPRSSNSISLLNQAAKARKETPKVVEVNKKSVRKAFTSGSEFKSPRSSNLTSLLNQAVKEDKRNDLDAVTDKLASQGALIEKLLAENKNLQENLLKENRKLQELIAGSEMPQGESRMAEVKSAEFAKLGFCNYDIDYDDLYTDVDDMNELSSAVSSNKTSEMNRMSGMSELEKSAIQSVFGATKVSTAKAPASWSIVGSRLSYHLRVEQKLNMHVECCRNCSSSSSLDSACYFFKMIRYIENENDWKVPYNLKYNLKCSSYKNYGSVKLYEAHLREECHKILGHSVLREIDDYYLRVISPMGAIVKNLYICRAKVLVNILVIDEASLLEAKVRLLALGFKKIKVGAALDISVISINDASPKLPFRYLSSQDGLKWVTRGCWLEKTDVEQILSMVCGIFAIKFFCSIRAMFGYAPCPYYNSTWGAEFLRWVNCAGVPAAFMVDDWLKSSSTEEQAKRNWATLTSVFVLAGFVLAVNKEAGQRITFLGVLIDTLRMCITFDEIHARSMMFQMIEHVKSIETGYDLDHTTIRSVAGKLEWYSEVLQSCRIHLRSGWLYVKYKNRLSPVRRHKLSQDFRWCIKRLDAWSNKGFSGIEHRIVSVEDLLTSTESICIMASNASSTDGFGYYWGNKDVDDFQYMLKNWGVKYEFVLLHTGELQARRHFVERNFDKADYKVQLLALDKYQERSLRDLQVSETRVEGRQEEGNERSEKGLSGVSEREFSPGVKFVLKYFTYERVASFVCKHVVRNKILPGARVTCCPP
jgi:hypothetical protein